VALICGNEAFGDDVDLGLTLLFECKEASDVSLAGHQLYPI